jgi:spermidine synthase
VLSSPLTEKKRRAHAALLFGTLVIAVCGLVYELLAGTISSYLLGDSVYQFSIVIGVFMAAMGFGAYLTRFIDGDLAGTFVGVQLALGLVGGASAPILFYAFASGVSYNAILGLVLVGTGTLVGLEIPLILRLLREERSLQINLSNVLSLDYVGALFAAVAFPVVLVPQLGLIRTSLFFGLANVLVGALALVTLGPLVARRRTLSVLTVLIAVLIVGALIGAESLERSIESKLHTGNIIHSQSTPYQRIVITEDAGIINLYLNGGLQFSTIDEHRYHEALVLPAMALASRRYNVLILGGGDGLVAQRVLTFADVKSVTLVDLDPAVTTLFKDNPKLAALNGHALSDARVRVVNEDAGKFIEKAQSVYDVVIMDLPDPRDVNLSRLYTRLFYTQVARRLAAGGVMVTQATSPVYAREAFWSIVTTLESVPAPDRRDVMLDVLPYHAYVPTFGDWGFVMASPRRMHWDSIDVKRDARFLNADALSTLTQFPPDIARLDVDINTVQSHVLPRYYELGWSRWYR